MVSPTRATWIVNCHLYCDHPECTAPCAAPCGGITDCNSNGIPDDCEPDCNGNGAADGCDISGGFSLDTNGNLIPDECDTIDDCNENGVDDACDLGVGTSVDCNYNGVPDECESQTDCNSNGILDICEDCNANGFADSCDIAAGTSMDCGSENDCCVAHFCPGCEEQAVQDCVCTDDPDHPCCTVAWTFDCAAIAAFACGATCGATPDGIPDECQRYRDCDQNGIPDQCDLDCAAGGLCADFQIGCGDGADCNANCILDSCDIAMYLSPDCNGNGVPDECDIAAGTSCDTNGNGVPDECEGVPEPPHPERLPDSEGNPVSTKNRYISIKAGTAGSSQAIRVRFVSLPSPFDIWDGMDFFVGEPREACENSGKDLDTAPEDCPPALPTVRFWAARLECDPPNPYFMDWHGRCVSGECVGGLDAGAPCVVDDDCQRVVHLYHEGIIPSGKYYIQVIDEACSLEEEGNYSAPLTMTQARWGDVCGPGPAGACTAAADGEVDVANDVLGVLDKFANVNNLQKTRADIEPGDDGFNNGPDFKVNVANDVLYTLAAFGGASYPFTPDVNGPCPPE